MTAIGGARFEQKEYPVRRFDNMISCYDRHFGVGTRSSEDAALQKQGMSFICGRVDLLFFLRTEASHPRGFFMDLFPTRQGFDYFFGTPTSNDKIVNLYRNEELIEPKADLIASTMDMLPTLAALAGAEAPTDRVIDGEDIRQLFHGEFDKATADKAYYYYLRVHLQAVRQDQWKLHLPRDAEPIGAAPFSRNTHISPDDRIGFDALFLMDLEHDIGESTNVADKHPQVTQRLLELAEAMREDLGDYDRVGKNMRFFDTNGQRPTTPPVPE